ncbi:TIR domain-containing protein [Agrobacterium rhizogenes]|uniref:TIR domain-containing protein n=1 Tax=Rhizobium rhizogenes TaxID=359 RepID=UPI00115CB0CC|nr:TIR domain-containing protein [Rhizobium rhizogenes]NTF55018.1 TIR domain-containing protein [Rhizobium rhizogenes]NTF74598.1 TIR domain-containing protein [Rhizobium rhizogenes]NTF98415.1 TIR domain-containing protein [Rhizobium rhizogenes]NTJ52079.1 TIR domain-containing protein [Rhizobium rhizogenes]TRB23540.1 TIR domain-containing protein [Rhizobium rhizogenes]
MSDIFLSHAVADRHLAEILVDFLVDAIGVPEKSIFCSSVPGHGNPLTYDFNKNMRTQIQNPKLVILLMTPSYMESSFCLMELGATWALELHPLPVVVPPITFADVTRTIGQVQAWDITNHEELESFREIVLRTLELEGRSNHSFGRKRKKWETDLTAALNGLTPATKVSRLELLEVEKQASLFEDEMVKYSREVTALEEKLATYEGLRPVAMIIEPEPSVIEGLRQLLDQEGFVVAGVARTEKEAIELARIVRPDIILSETVLADGSSGISAVMKIIEEYRAYPLFVTAFPERLLKGRPERTAIVAKPFDPDDLKREIRKCYNDLLEDRERRKKKRIHII